MIPKKIHQIWFNYGSPSPDEELLIFSRTLQEFNKDYSYMLWSFDEVLSLIANDYPDLLDFYNNLPTDVHRCDIAKYVILHSNGGIYADTDIECLKSFDDLLNNYIVTGKAIIDNFEFIASGLLMSVKGAPEWIDVIKNAEKRLVGNLNPMFSTGPMALDIFSALDKVTILGKDLFYPSSRSDESYTVHHERRSWLSPTRAQLLNKKIP